jgi:hypothetical protein
MGKLVTKKLIDIMDLPPPPYIFEGLMRDRSLTLLSAKSGSRKTFLILAMAVAMDYELKLWGTRQPTRNFRPLILGGDSPDWDIGQQSKKIMNGYKLGKHEQAMCSIEGIFHAGNLITNPQFYEAIKDYHASDGFDTLFIDCHRKYFGGNENDSNAVAQVVSLYQRLRDELGIGIVLIHHWGKPKDVEYGGNDKARGSTALVDGVDFHFTLEYAGCVLTLEAAKNRGHVAANNDRIRIEMIETETSIEFRELTFNLETAILAIMYGGLPVSRKVLGDAVKQHFPNLTGQQLYKLVDNTLMALKRQGKVESPERGLWRLTINGNA